MKLRAQGMSAAPTTPDWYKVLDVPRNATPDTIRDAYR